MRNPGSCRCGGDMPGRCPGPNNCPMCAPPAPTCEICSSDDDAEECLGLVRCTDCRAEALEADERSTTPPTTTMETGA